MAGRCDALMVKPPDPPAPGAPESAAAAAPAEASPPAARRARVSPYLAGIKSRCPRCGEGALFDGFLRVARRCRHCDLDLSAEDSGDGPAVFVIFIVGFVVTAAALAVEIAIEPPYWVHALLWLPLTLLVSAVLLRPMKATMIALQYHHKAAGGRMDDAG